MKGVILTLVKLRLKNWGKCLLHDLVLLIMVTFTTSLQFSFATETGIADSFMFAVTSYKLNPITMIIGNAIFVILYHILWVKWLKHDFIVNCKGQRFWSIVYMLITMITVLAIFIQYIIIMLFKFGLFSSIGTLGNSMPYLTIGYVVIYSLVESTITYLRTKKQGGKEDEPV